MPETEKLAILIDIVDSFSDELNQLLIKLGEVEGALQAVDDHTIDIDVDDRELDSLFAKLAATQVGGAAAGGAAGSAGGAAGGGISRNMRRISEGAEEASEGLFEMNLRMENVHNALAKLVPLILVVIGALPAMIGGFVAVAGAALAAAGALAALTAFAGLGAALEAGGGDAMQGFSDLVDQIQEDFMDAFRPLAERLAPLFEDAIDGLDRLFQEIANEGDALVDLQEQAKAFGGFIIATLPSFLREVAQFAEAASQAMGIIVSALAEIDIFGMLAGILADTLPLLMMFGSEVAALIGHVYELSLGFFAVTNGILAALNVFLDIITVGGRLTEAFGLLTGMVLASWTAFMILNSSLVKFATVTLAKLGAMIFRLVSAYAAQTVATLEAWAATAGLTKQMYALAGAIALTGLGALLVLFGAVAGGAAMASTEIDRATDSLRAFENQRNRMMDGNNPYATPEFSPGQNLGRSRFSGGGGVTVNVEGDADDETLRKQTNNAMYRLKRPSERGI